MKYAALKTNDVSNAPGICVSFFVQGCSHHCFGCHNPETWSFTEGKEFTSDTLTEIIEALTANEVHRNFCVLGGEPLDPANIFLTDLVISFVREKLPNVKIYLWTGYTIDELSKRTEPHLKHIINNIDCIIDGPFKIDQRDITLPMRGSRNQNIYYAPFDLWDKI